MKLMTRVDWEAASDRPQEPPALSRSDPGHRRFVQAAAVVLVAVAAGLTTLHLRRDRWVPPADTLPSALSTPMTPQEVVFRQDIDPLMEAFDKRNRIAADSAVRILAERISAHRAGIEPFAEDITGWGSRAKILYRSVTGFFREEDPGHPETGSGKALVAEKFQEHILSESAVKADLVAVFSQFNEDLAASRNLLYADVRLPLAKLRTSTRANDVDLARYVHRARVLTSDLAKGMAPDTVVAGILTIAAGTIAVDIAADLSEAVLATILTRIGTQLAIEGLEAGGATVTAGAAGAGGGSAVGPVGTGIGFAVGLLAGYLVDLWMSNEFHEQILKQCNGFLEGLQERLLKGDGKTPGMERTFQESVRIAGKSQREALLLALTEVVR